MICSWCEEESQIIKLCNIESHNVCKKCYDKYLEMYPKRKEGCPYCKGNEEKIMEVVDIEAPQVDTSVVVADPVYTDFFCDTNVIATTIAMIFIVLLFLYCITKAFYLI